MADSPGSSLSSLSSEDFAEDVKTEDQDSNLDIMHDHSDRHIMPPAKRQRVGPFSHRSTPLSHMEPQPDLTDISSDTSGHVPDSPRTGPMQMQEDEPGHEQITVCRWEGCPAGDLRNMDALVQHIHDDHIGTRQKMYSCQWEDCARKGMNHASGYALRAHMRSHTREKPFYCALPGKGAHRQEVSQAGTDPRQNAIDRLLGLMLWPSTCELCTKRKHSDPQILFPGTIPPLRRSHND